MHDGVRLRLCVMMFLEYAAWGAWGVSIGGYMNGTLNFEPSQIGLIFSTTAVAAMISPLFLGYVADRFFATEKILSALHLIGGILLVLAAQAGSFSQLYPIMQVYALCYMPTLTLTNSISFANIPDAKKDFPGIRVWGTWGWIISGWVIGFLVGGTSNVQFYVAAGLSFVLAAFCLMLPHTPPKGKAAPSQEVPSGSSVLQLLKDPSFLVFVVCSFLICIPLSFYYNLANIFLVQIDAPYPTSLMTIGQLTEVGFMAAMPFFIARLGIKKMLLVGMFAWVLRYLAFGTLSLPAVIFGLALHGICYDFYFVASYIYVDTRVDVKQRASAQSFIAFVMLGVGMFVGSLTAGFTLGQYPPNVLVKAERISGDKTEKVELPLPEWDAEGKSPFAKALGLKGDGVIRFSMIPAEYTEVDEKHGITTRYDRISLIDALGKADRDADNKVTREEWLAARRYQWPYIWLWPAGGALITCVLFLVGFRDKGAEVAGKPEEQGGVTLPPDTEMPR